MFMKIFDSSWKFKLTCRTNLNNFVQRGGEVLLYLTGADRVCVPAPPGPVEIHELIHVPVLSPPGVFLPVL